MIVVRLTFRLLTDTFHGRGDGGQPEWPPSPLRVFQALVAAAGRKGTLSASANALQWIENLPPPVIIAPEGSRAGAGYRLSVPHNAMDIVGSQWAKGKEGSPGEHRAMKAVLPHRLPERAEIHYLWHLSAESAQQATLHGDTLFDATRSVVVLGWGIDFVVGDGGLNDHHSISTNKCKRWEPRADGRIILRTPRAGSLADLEQRYALFLKRTRYDDQTIRPPSVLSSFDMTAYARTDMPSPQPVATFSIIDLKTSKRRAFHPGRQGMAVAGMLRHAARSSAQDAGWSAERIANLMGHGPEGEPRLLLMPALTIENRPQTKGCVVTSIRRVLVMSNGGGGQDVEWAKQALAGRDLVDENSGEVRGVIALAPRSELASYLTSSTTWTSVTPVILPGFDDPGGLRAKLRSVRSAADQLPLLERLARRREGLVRKALKHAGVDNETIFNATIEVRSSGFLAGVQPATHYAAPKHLRSAPRLHVRITFNRLVAGPLCIGSGRFSGLGLLAALS